METMRVEASSGGGIVTVAMNGSKRVLSVKVDPEAVKGGDVEMLEDLFLAAVNEAMRKVDAALAEKLGGLTGGLSIPGLF
jgi:DNA-binding YbaB/EbfC family protein